MSDGQDNSAERKALSRTANPEMAKLDQDIRARFARRTGDISAFLQQWIRLDDAQAMFFGNRGIKGENYLQFCLANGDIDMALPIAKMCAFYAESTDAERIAGYLNHIDAEGNDIWHYLADNLKESEDDDSLAIAQLLVQLEIDYCRKNDADESPLARLLVPTPRWPSVNSMLLAKQLTIDEIEASFPKHVTESEQIKAEIMAGIFFSDLAENDARLASNMVYFASHPKSEMPDRLAIGRALFDYAGGKRSETVLMKMIETEHKEVFEKALEFLYSLSDQVCKAMAKGDNQLAKAQAQAYLYRRLGRRNRIFQGVLMKAVIADRASYISSLLRLLVNEPVVVTKQNAKGETERELLLMDKTSPSPANPALSLLLQQDARGNLAFHQAVLMNRSDCLRKLFYGLSLVDVHAILCRIPNRFNLTVADLLSQQAAFQKLSVEVKAKRMTIEDAQQWMAQIKAVDRRIIEFLAEAIKKAEDVIQRTGGAKSAKPTFDLARVPTVVLAMQNAQATATAARA